MTRSDVAVRCETAREGWVGFFAVARARCAKRVAVCGVVCTRVKSRQRAFYFEKKTHVLCSVQSALMKPRFNMTIAYVI